MMIAHNFKHKLFTILPHFLALGFAMLYAWQISNSAYVKTGLQFVAPTLVIMLIHLIWIIKIDNLQYNLVKILYERTFKSTLSLTCIIILISIVAPMPAQSNTLGDAVESILIIIMCLAILAGIAAVIIFIIFAVFKMVSGAIRAITKNKSNSNDTKLFDFGSISFVSLLLAVASLEGLPSTYSFDANSTSTASQYIKANPSTVWKTLETATSPKFILPKALQIFPQPTAVEKDEGIHLNARRVVKIKGREGSGYLKLQITERSQNSVTFTVLSDTSPIADWVKHKKLIYTVTPSGTGNGVLLSVTLEHERLLSPSWFFTPAMNLSAYLAMDVLARDVKARSES